MWGGRGRTWCVRRKVYQIHSFGKGSEHGVGNGRAANERPLERRHHMEVIRAESSKFMRQACCKINYWLSTSEHQQQLLISINPSARISLSSLTFACNDL
jgi:hypothetical protein